MLKRFHSAVIAAADFEAAVGHYATLLGRAPAFSGHDPKRGTRTAFFHLTNMSLEIRECAQDADGGLEILRLDATAESTTASRVEAWLAARGIEFRESTHVALEALDVVESSDGTSTCQWTSTPIGAQASRGIEVEVVSGFSSASLPIESPNVEEKSSIRDLDHVVILSADVESTKDFYESGLGIRLALDKTFEERQVRLLFFRIGDVTIEIGSRLGADPRPGGVDRFGGLAWEVVDVDAIRDRLLGEQFDVSPVRSGNKPGTRVCTVRNPVHGVPTLLIQPVPR